MIDIRISHYFPLQFIALGIGLLFGAGLLTWQANYLLVPVFLVFGMIFLTTNHRLQVDVKSQTFREYVWLLGFKSGKIKPLPKPTHVVIQPVNKEIRYGDIDYGRVRTHQRRATAYLKFEHDQPIYLGAGSNSQILTDQLAGLIEALKVPIHNNAKRTLKTQAA
ncbi:MAG: hypothetical protein AAGA66_08715 [Bacteroidota bacterium]